MGKILAETCFCHKLWFKLLMAETCQPWKWYESCLFFFTSQPQSINTLWLVLISHPNECRRLSCPGWLVTYYGGLPAHRWTPIPVLIGPVDISNAVTAMWRALDLSPKGSNFNFHQSCWASCSYNCCFVSVIHLQHTVLYKCVYFISFFSRFTNTWKSWY